MRFYILFILSFAWINLFAFKSGPEDTVTNKLVIKPISNVYAAIDKHAKYDEWDQIGLYMADTLFIVVDRILYRCNREFAIETLIKARILIKNNDYKYTLNERPEYTYNYSYFGYYEHEKYEVILEFTEYNGEIIFVAIVAMAVDD